MIWRITVPVIMIVMKRLVVKKDMAGLKEFCEERVRVGGRIWAPSQARRA